MKELIDKAMQKFMLDNGFSGDKIHHHLRAEYDCFVECKGCRGNSHSSHGVTCLYKGMRTDRKKANEPHTYYLRPDPSAAPAVPVCPGDV